MKYSLRSLMIVVTLVAMYFGMYSQLLRPVEVDPDDWPCVVIPGDRHADFRAGGEFSRLMFTPAVWLDRKVRPDF